MSSTIPVFAIVGHPNKGKSSLVSTLAQDGSVSISAISGTTASNRTFPMVVDGKELYRLVDTPGFQRARAAMEWMQRHRTSASQHADVVKKFVELHQDDPKFSAECQLLKPILEGAGILYVIDGSAPYGPEYDAEMEILRWTGQPSMALINHIGEGEYLEDWERPLSQYFRIVRVFNAQTAGFDPQINLLSGFAELSEHWREPLSMATRILQQRRKDQIQQAFTCIAETLYSMLKYRQQLPIDKDQSQSVIDGYISAFQQSLKSMEADSRRQIEKIFNYPELERKEQQLEIFSEDLFAEQSWKLFGLSRDQLVTSGIVGGAAGGALLDIGSGGLTAFVGSGLGAIVGGIGAWFGSKQLINTRILGMPMGGNEIIIGPLKNPNFPWVLIGRALTHLEFVLRRTHAIRTALEIRHDTTIDYYDRLRSADKKTLLKLFTQATDDKQAKPETFVRVATILAGLLNHNGNSN